MTWERKQNKETQYTFLLSSILCDNIDKNRKERIAAVEPSKTWKLRELCCLYAIFVPLFD